MRNTEFPQLTEYDFMHHAVSCYADIRDYPPSSRNFVVPLTTSLIMMSPRSTLLLAESYDNSPELWTLKEKDKYGTFRRFYSRFIANNSSKNVSAGNVEHNAITQVKKAMSDIIVREGLEHPNQANLMNNISPRQISDMGVFVRSAVKALS